MESQENSFDIDDRVNTNEESVMMESLLSAYKNFVDNGYKDRTELEKLWFTIPNHVRENPIFLKNLRDVVNNSSIN